MKVLDITITTETSLINNILENVAEWLKIKVYIVNHKGNVHGKQFLMIIISSFSSYVPLLSQFRKSVVPCPALYKYNGDVVIKLYCIVKNDCLAFKTTVSVFLNHKSIMV